MNATPFACVVSVGVILGFAEAPHAHRLDEYLQAVRIGIARDRIEVDLDLTPGASVARGVIDEIDADHDGVLSPGEQEGYARRVLRDVRLELDGRPLILTAATWRFPVPEEMTVGMGRIEVRAAAAVGGMADGPHRARFLNRHRTDVGVYLANALVPSDPSVRILGQERDVRQRELVVAYDTGAARRGWPLALATLATALVALVISRSSARR